MTWYAAVAPPKTPTQIIEHLSGAIAKALREPEVTAKLEALQATPILNSPSEAMAFIAVDSERWRRVIVSAGVKPE